MKGIYKRTGKDNILVSIYCHSWLLPKTLSIYNMLGPKYIAGMVVYCQIMTHGINFSKSLVAQRNCLRKSTGCSNQAVTARNRSPGIRIFLFLSPLKILGGSAERG